MSVMGRARLLVLRPIRNVSTRLGRIDANATMASSNRGCETTQAHAKVTTAYNAIACMWTPTPTLAMALRGPDTAALRKLKQIDADNDGVTGIDNKMKNSYDFWWYDSCMME